jgi:predicted ABC-type ATPase
MTVVAGPSGSGKSMRFSVHGFGVDAFYVDDRCCELHGSYQGIPPAIRQQAQRECEAFVEGHIRDLKSFATETTLRTAVAIDQAMKAKAAGFFTSILYIGTGDVELNIQRVRRRGLGGGHSAPPETIRDNYTRSLGNLALALGTFDRGEVYDNSGTEPRLVLEVRNTRVKQVHTPLPAWVRDVLSGTPIGSELGREWTA